MRINPTHDPIFRKRLIMRQQAYRHRQGLIYLLFALIIVWLITFSSSYWSHLFIQEIPSVTATSPADTHDVPKEIHDKNQNISTVITPPAPASLTAQPQALSAEAQPATVATEINLSVAAAATPSPAPVDPIPPPSSTPEPIAAQQADNIAPPPTDTAIATNTTIKPAEPTEPVESPKIFEKEEVHPLVTELTETALEQIKRERLTSPSGDNAFETYRALIQIATPTQANLVLEAIIDSYVQQTQRAVKTNKIARLPKILEKITELAPQHPRLSTLLTEIQTPLEQYLIRLIKQKNLTAPNNDNAVLIAQTLQVYFPNSAAWAGAREDLLSGLQAQLIEQINQRKWIEPKSQNAYVTAQAMQSLAAAHPVTVESVNMLTNQYYELAIGREKIRDYVTGLTWVERGLSLDSQHALLQQLKASLLEKQASNPVGERN